MGLSQIYRRCKICPDTDHHLSGTLIKGVSRHISSSRRTNTVLCSRRQNNSASTKVINQFVMRALSFLIHCFSLSIFVIVPVSGTHSFWATHMHTQQEQLLGAATHRADVCVWTQRNDRPVDLFKPQGNEMEGDAELSTISRFVCTT